MRTSAIGPGKRAILLAFGLLCPLVVFAALGADQRSIDAESAQLHGSGLTTAMHGYSVVEIKTPQQIRIRQFVSPAGLVFAVVWRGPFKPDLRMLLGRHFDSYRVAPRPGGATRRGVQVIQQPDLVVESGGRQRSFFGIAYVPSLVPAGVDVGSLQ